MLRWLALLLAALSCAGEATAQGYPTKTVRIVVPYPPGGPPDVVGRMIAGRLQEAWSQPVVIENRPGANGNIGAQLVAKSANDGTTLLLHASSLVINPLLYAAPGYDAFRDFAPISEVFDYKLIVVTHPTVPANTLKELVTLARSQPGGLNYASAGGVGAPTHLSVEMFKQMAGIELVHIPYQGASQALNDLLAGNVPLMFNNPILSLPYVSTGKLKAIATTGLARMKQLPDVPTVAESGYPGFDVGTWFGLWAPAGTPAEVIETINAAVAKTTRSPETREKIEAMGSNAIGSSVAEFAAFQKAESERWAKVIKAAGIKLE